MKTINNFKDCLELKEGEVCLYNGGYVRFRRIDTVNNKREANFAILDENKENILKNLHIYENK